MIDANALEILAIDIKCHAADTCLLKFLIYGVLILWPVSFFQWLSVYTCCCGLCVKMGEAKSTRTNDSQVVAEFIKSNIFARFGMPRVIISDGGLIFVTAPLKPF